MPAPDDHAGDGPRELGPGSSVRVRLTGLRLALSLLRRDARRLGGWLEQEVLPAVRRTGGDMASLELRDESVCLSGPAARETGDACEPTPELAGLLRDCGIERLDMDARLESNQVMDAVLLLRTFRCALARPDRGGRWAKALRGEGVLFACAHIRIADATLNVSYSYCTTCFSRAVEWFEARHRHFSDHRALFSAAPYYALIPAALTMVIFVAVMNSQNPWVRLAGAFLEAGVVFLLVYVFFLVIGSVEYDKEERSYRVEQARARLEQYADRIGRDLATAREVQQNLLPDAEAMPLPNRLAWAWRFEPETEVGGDYFDAAVCADGRVGILFADVSGHGLAAAFITALLKSAFEDWVCHAGPLEGFVRAANHNLCRFTPAGSFAVLVIARYAPDAGTLEWCNCGHLPEPFVLEGAERAVTALDGSQAMLLGIEESIEVDTARIALRPGQKLLLATDGLLEAPDAEGDMFGQQRIVDLLTERAACPIHDVVDALADRVAEYSAGVARTDDRTVLGMEVLG